jgi:hypothetical protein
LQIECKLKGAKEDFDHENTILYKDSEAQIQNIPEDYYLEFFRRSTL